MKVLGLSVLAAIAGYLIGLFGRLFVVEAFFSNVYEKSMEAAMSRAFVFGPLMALVPPL